MAIFDFKTSGYFKVWVNGVELEKNYGKAEKAEARANEEFIKNPKAEIYVQPPRKRPLIDMGKFTAMVGVTQSGTTPPPPESNQNPIIGNLTISNVQSNSIDLNCTATDDNQVSSFDIYQNGVLQSTHLGGSLSSYTISGLTPSTSYTFYAIARDNEGATSSQSNTVNGTTSGSPTGTFLYPYLFDFEILPANPDRIYFKTLEPITGTNTTGFLMNGNTLTGLNINAGQITGHYFTVSTDFKWWNNNAIRYEGGGDIANLNSVALENMDLQYVSNQTQPTEGATGTLFVDSSVGSSGNGSSEAQAFKTIQEAMNVASPGNIVYIKSGDYGAENPDMPTSGTEANPITFEGYKTTPGDITTLYYDVGDGAFNTSEMPTLDGANRAVGKGFELSSSTSFIILRNIQITNYVQGVDMGSNCTKNIFERVITKDIGDTNDAGYGFNFDIFSKDNSHNKIIECLSINSSQMNFAIGGDFNIIENCKSYCDEKDPVSPINLTTDYYVYITGHNNIIRNSYVEKAIGPESHNGHGFTTKQEADYNLFEHNLAVNIQNSFSARHSTSRYNVFRDCEAHADTVHRKTGSGDYTAGISIVSDGSYNTFDRIYIHDVDNAFYLNENTEDSATDSIGHDNVFKNIVIHDCKFGMRIRNSEAATAPFNNNKFLNITWHNVTTIFKIYDNAGGISFSGNTIDNNIFSNCSNLFHNFSGYDSPTGFTYDYNNYFGSFPAEGTNEIVGNPLFTNAGAFDFTLQSGSPCIDSGKTDVLAAADFNGSPRSSVDAFDVGAYEF